MYPVGALPIGTLVNNVERRPGDGGHVGRVAGSCAVIAKRLDDMIVVRVNNRLFFERNSKLNCKNE